MRENLNNHGRVTGRLTADPVVRPNANGSLTIRFTVAARNSWKDTDGTVHAQYLPLIAYIPARSARNFDRNVYAMLHKGDKITVSYTVMNNNYTDKNGERHYELALQAQTVMFEESKSTVDERAARRAEAEPA